MNRDHILMRPLLGMAVVLLIAGLDALKRAAGGQLNKHLTE